MDQPCPYEVLHAGLRANQTGMRMRSGKGKEEDEAVCVLTIHQLGGERSSMAKIRWRF